MSNVNKPLKHRQMNQRLLDNVFQTSLSKSVYIRGISSSSLPSSITGKIAFEPKNAETVEPSVVPGTESATISPPEIDLSGFLDQLPPPPSLETVTEVMSGPITSSDLNLTWWCPTGGVYNVLDLLHSVMPWWASIAFATLIVRILMTPIVIGNQKNAAKMSEYMPQFMAAQKKYQKAMRIGNERESEYILLSCFLHAYSWTFFL